MMKINSCATLLLFAGGIAATHRAAAAPPLGVAGQLAPPLSVEQWIQSPDDGQRLDLNSLRGRVVVIEFWATTCGPCITSIPWWNKLNERFADRPVTFLAVAGDPDPKTVRKLLQKRPMRGIIGVDTDRSTSKTYGVNGIPATVVIDQNGLIVGWTTVDTLFEQSAILENVLKGRKVEIARSPWVQSPDLFADVTQAIDPGETDQPKPLCLILIRPTSGLPSPFGQTSRERRAQNVDLRQIIEEFYPVRGGALAFEFIPTEDKYDVMFRWSKRDWTRGFQILQEAIEATFNITVTTEKRLSDVYLMTVDPKRAAMWEPARASMKFDRKTGKTAPTQAILDRMIRGEEFFCGVGETQILADGYAWALGVPVIDETNVDGYYTYCYPWSKEKSTPAQTIELAKKHLGITLTKTQREIETIVVRRAVHKTAGEKK